MRNDPFVAWYRGVRRLTLTRLVYGVTTCQWANTLGALLRLLLGALFRCLLVGGFAR